MFNKHKIKSPFAPDSSNYFLPWMVMIMVFLAILCSSLAISLEKVLSKWENSITGSITIQVLPSEKEIENKTLFNNNIKELVNSLKTTPGIQNARYLKEQEINKLLKPWFGVNELINELPIPHVIDVTLADDISVDIDVLKSVVAYKAEHASIDIHQAWLKSLTNLISSVKILVFTILIIILTTTIVLVIYATTTSVSLHKNAISLLHLIGAKDNYIAFQIAIKAFVLSLKGASVGMILVIPIIITIGNYIKGFNNSLSSMVSLNMNDWFILLSCAIFAGVVSGTSAYITVLKKLKQMS